MVAVSDKSEPVHRLRRKLSMFNEYAPAVFDGKEPNLCRESWIKGDEYYTGIEAISIAKPGPIVDERVIFFK